MGLWYYKGGGGGRGGGAGHDVTLAVTTIFVVVVVVVVVIGVEFTVPRHHDAQHHQYLTMHVSMHIIRILQMGLHLYLRRVC